MDKTLAEAMLLFGGWIFAAVGIAVAILRRRDRLAKEAGKTDEQVRAGFAAALELRSALHRSVPGLLLIVFGLFLGIDRHNQGDSDWWIGFLFVPVGWVLIPLLARRKWHRYLQLKRFADKSQDDFLRNEPYSGEDA